VSAEKNRRYAERLRSLIEEAYEVATLDKATSSGYAIRGKDRVALQSWMTKVDNIIEVIFGAQSSYFRRFRKVRGGIVSTSGDIYDIAGFLGGALDDLENGFLKSQELLMVGEIFETVLDEEKYLNKFGFKDPAAVLARVVLEDSLKRLARESGLDASLKSSHINDELRKAGRYPQPQWRLIQAWLDVGNAAAHGKFEDYKDDDVEAMIDGVDRFVAIELRAELTPIPVDEADS
jgi:hypothetical protein